MYVCVLRGPGFFILWVCLKQLLLERLSISSAIFLKRHIILLNNKSNLGPEQWLVSSDRHSSGTQRWSLVSLGGCWKDKLGIKKMSPSVYYTSVYHNDQMQCLTGLNRLCTLWLLFTYNYCPGLHKERHCFLASWRLIVVMRSMLSNEKEWKWSYVTSQMKACRFLLPLA